MMQVMSGEATPAQIAALPGRPADEGRDASRRSPAAPGPCARTSTPAAPAARRRWSTPAAPAATAAARSTSRPPRRWSPRPPAPPSPSTATARCPRAAGRPTCWRRWACGSSSPRPTSPPASTRSASASCSRRPTTRPCATPARCAASWAVRTVFNLLGPLTNPAGARRQVIGVYSAGLVEPIAHVLGELGAEHALVVHGAAGSTRSRRPAEPGRRGARRRACRRSRSTRESSRPAPCRAPDDLGGRRRRRRTPPSSHRLRRRARAAARRRGPERRRRAATWRRGDDLEAGIDRAVEAIDSGAAAGNLDRLVAFTTARAGCGVSGYLSRLSGDVRRDAPEPARGFAHALAAGADVAVIAEVKRGSPSQGPIRPDADVWRPPRPTSWAGRPPVGAVRGARLRRLRRRSGRGPRAVSIPAIAKDFTVFPEQVARQRLAGADAILVILAMVTDDEARAADGDRGPARDGHAGRGAHRRGGRAGAGAASAPIVGVNARDLRDARDRPRPPARTASRPAADAVRVAESGIAGREDVIAARDAGADAVLVGDVADARPGTAGRAGGGARVATRWSRSAV